MFIMLGGSLSSAVSRKAVNSDKRRTSAEQCVVVDSFSYKQGRIIMPDTVGKLVF